MAENPFAQFSLEKAIGLRWTLRGRGTRQGHECCRGNRDQKFAPTHKHLPHSRDRTVPAAELGFQHLLLPFDSLRTIPPQARNTATVLTAEDTITTD